MKYIAQPDNSHNRGNIHTDVPGVLHEEVVGGDGAREGSDRRQHVPLSPGETEVPEGIPQAHQGGRVPSRRIAVQVRFNCFN